MQQTDSHRIALFKALQVSPGFQELQEPRGYLEHQEL